jgi:hypothetical protein
MSAPVTPTTVAGLYIPQLWASETITVGDADVTGLVVGLQPGVTLRGRIEYVGSRELTLRRNGVTLMPLSASMLYSRTRSVGPSLDGIIEIPTILPGRYSVQPTAAVPGWRLKSVTAGGVDVTDTALIIEARDISDVVITMTDLEPATLEGSTTLKSGESYADAQVCVFPADRRYWAEPFAAARRFLSTRLSPGSKFEIGDIPPGEYLVAISMSQALGGMVPSMDWMDDTALEELARTALRVQLADGEQKVIQVRR